MSVSFGDIATLRHAMSTVTPAMLRTRNGEHLGAELAAVFVERYAACRAMLLAGVETWRTDSVTTRRRR